MGSNRSKGLPCKRQTAFKLHLFSCTHYGGGAFEFWSAAAGEIETEKEKDTEKSIGILIEREKEGPK